MIEELPELLLAVFWPVTAFWVIDVDIAVLLNCVNCVFEVPETEMEFVESLPLVEIWMLVAGLELAAVVELIERSWLMISVDWFISPVMIC